MSIVQILFHGVMKSSLEKQPKRAGFIYYADILHLKGSEKRNQPLWNLCRDEMGNT